MRCFASLRRPVLLILAGFGLALVFSAPSAAGEKIEIEITEVPYRPVHAFLRIHFEFIGKQEIVHQEWQTSQKDGYLGFGLGLISARDTDFQYESNLSYERYKTDLIGIPDLDYVSQFNFQIGGRYLPRYPTFGIGRMAARLTFSALGGAGLIFPGSYDMGYELSMILAAGLMISSGDNPSGILIEFVYRPLESGFKVNSWQESALDEVYWGKLIKKPAWGIRIAWIFGP
ncbi:MAG: hypothetical protein JW747_05655 [Candidatus Aminicenantes bacterium]|nr:hypothetical protein [Candidatus Aminicenantes bacterium]